MTLASPVKNNLDISALREDFPVLRQTVHAKPLAYFDNGATTQKPSSVIEAVADYYRTDNANVHRGVHSLSERATLAYEAVRDLLVGYINAGSREQLIFTKGTTDAINLLAASWGDTFIQAGDEIILTAMEHHANIVPWQILAEKKQAKLRVLPIDERGVLLVDQLPKLINPRTKLLALSHISNVLGTINPVVQITQLARQQGVAVLIDGAQALPHQRIDVKALDCDFYTFSAHKMFGPTGVGVLYAKQHWLEQMPPYQGGGDMIKMVSFEKTLYNDLPYKFEAGTPNIAGVIGLGKAVEYLMKLDFAQIQAYEQQLNRYLEAKLKQIGGVTIYGNAPTKAAITSFTLDTVHPHDAATLLDEAGVAVRAGHHCAMPLMQQLGVNATLRASLAFYNTRAEVDQFIAALVKIKQIFF